MSATIRKTEGTPLTSGESPTARRGMTRRRATDRADVSGAAGFTLVEMVVTLVIVGVLGAGIVGLLMRQSAFYNQNDERIFAGQTLRATSDLVPAELRVASGKDIILSKEDSVTIRYPIKQGVVCAVDGSDNVYYYVYHEPDNANLAGGVEGSAFQNPDSTDFTYEDGFDATGSATSTAQSTCEDQGVPTGLSSDDFREVTWSGAGVEGGAMIRTYGHLTYWFGDSNFGQGLALWRNDQEFIAPFSAETTTFEYLVCTTGCSWKKQVTDNSEQRSVQKMRIRAVAVGEGNNRYDVSQDLSYDVSLRNN